MYNAIETHFSFCHLAPPKVHICYVNGCTRAPKFFKHLSNNTSAKDASKTLRPVVFGIWHLLGLGSRSNGCVTNNALAMTTSLDCEAKAFQLKSALSKFQRGGSTGFSFLQQRGGNNELYKPVSLFNSVNNTILLGFCWWNCRPLFTGFLYSIQWRLKPAWLGSKCNKTADNLFLMLLQAIHFSAALSVIKASNLTLFMFHWTYKLNSARWLIDQLKDAS